MKFRILQNFLLFILLIVPVVVQAVIPVGYYNNAEGKKDAELKTALFTIIRPHTKLDYYPLSTTFRTTDWNPNGYFWDMYSTIQRSSWTGLNREHNLPKSWFGVSSEQVDNYEISTDVHNLYPSDATANSAKSNYPPGEVGTTSFDNGVFQVGTSNFTGYNGTVFEPADQYKGDFARDYMYMVTCYEDYSAVWQSLGTSSVLSRNTYPVFTTYGVNLLMKWHRNDPVSEKEINRNDAVYSLQHNRNPFIDHPELAEYIWGKYKGYAWSKDFEEPENDDNFYASYTPQTNLLHVNLKKPENAVFYIVTMSGIECLSGTFNASGNVNVQLKKGIYVLKVYTKTTRKTQKMVIY